MVVGWTVCTLDVGFAPSAAVPPSWGGAPGGYRSWYMQPGAGAPTVAADQWHQSYPPAADQAWFVEPLRVSDFSLFSVRNDRIRQLVGRYRLAFFAGLFNFGRLRNDILADPRFYLFVCLFEYLPISR